MNKKEILEIRKQFTMDNCNISRISLCYVTPEKEVPMMETKSLYSIPEEEIFKYLDLFRNGLSGKIGNKLFNLSCNAMSDAVGSTDTLRNTKLSNDSECEAFFDRVIQSYQTTENYLIIVAHGVYDIPGKTSDDEEVFDASEEVFDYLFCIICPVALSKAALAYQSDDCQVKDRIRDWVVESPVNGFLYPAFNDRSADINSLLYYTKKADTKQDKFLEALFGCTSPKSEKEEKEWFTETIDLITDGNCGLELAKTIQEKFQEYIVEAECSNNILELDKQDLGTLLKNCGINEEQNDLFQKSYEHEIGDKKVNISHLTNTKKITLDAGNFSVKIDAERQDIMDVKRINGRLCITLELDTNQPTLNGIPLKLPELV